MPSRPHNILFDVHGHAYLSDFGVAKALAAKAASKQTAALTARGMVLGTPEYMAPEVIMGQQYDGRADQYALAATVHEMLCGRVPFEGEAPTAILVKHTIQPPPALHELRPTVPLAVSQAVLRGLAKDPQARFENCSSLVRALVGSVQQFPSAAAAGAPAGAAARSTARPSLTSGE